MAHPLVLVAAAADGIALAVAGQGGAVARRQTEEGQLVLGVELPVVHQLHDHPGERALVVVGWRAVQGVGEGDHGGLRGGWPQSIAPF